MDIWKGTTEYRNFGVWDLIYCLSVIGVLIFIICFCCCYCIWAITKNPSYFDDMDRREIPGIELRHSNYEETLKIDTSTYRHQPELPSLEADNIACDVNDGIGNESDSGEASSDSNIEDNGNEQVIYNACNAGDHSDCTFRIEKNSDL
ncbi:hypothetical protein MSG28_006013 [Choristoneura fumiferana]|uniref:Uncharacterized protein n=2 Tax=Choristoneura fumiferana TaxID=7141 RepID=A0ACC0L1B0_CHOFU|nr:hypothetical protein MSG28_008970 [Choristoneura fumiferana]KAI8442552.1 hypothetical protein MSG28_006013 [Choristoneura fumiferana]